MMSESPAKNIDVVAGGEALVDMISTTKGASIEESAGFVKAFGGALANVAVGCARLGATTAFIGKVGDDPFGKFLCNTLKEAGVITSGLIFSADYETSLVFVNLDRSGEPTFYFYGRPSADLQLEPDEVDTDLIKAARFFHFGTVSLSAEPSRSATQAAVAAAKDAGAIISYDPNIRFHMWSVRNEAMEWTFKMLPDADLVKVNDYEAELMVGTREPERAAAKLLDMGPRLALVTMGERGVYYASHGAQGRVPGLSVNVVDTTGAGDAFVAGLLSSLASSEASDPIEDDKAIKNAVRRATAAAALTTEAVGAISAMPDRKTLDKAIKERFMIGDGE